jgi:hypothetical protein
MWTAVSFAAPSGQEGGPNLLSDGDFEWSVPWSAQDGRGEIRVAPAWRAWWVPKPSADTLAPAGCSHADYGCFWAVPEFGPALRIEFVYRVHGGLQAQKYFTYGRMHQAGLMQQVGNIPSNARLRFSIYMEAWMCYKFEECKYGKLSDKPSNMHLKIGIDPTGGDNPFSSDIVWSQEQAAWDAWVPFQVETVARNSTVTVFTHSRADWDWIRTNNDVYLDDASLVVIGQAQPTKPPAPPTRKPVATQPPRPTATPMATHTSTPTDTSTPTETPTLTETPLRRVATLPADDTATPIPRGLFSGLGSSGDGSPGGATGMIFLGAALFTSAVLIGIVIGQRRGPRAG